MTTEEFLAEYGESKVYFEESYRDHFIYKNNNFKIIGISNNRFRFLYEMSVNDLNNQFLSFSFIIIPPEG